VFKKIFVFLSIVATGLGIWVAFALWSGLYSIYTFPPSNAHPDGVTLLVSREEWEPMFNSPDYRPPAREPGKSAGVTLGTAPKLKRPLERRTIVKLPYIGWAYTKSLELEPPPAPKKP